MAETPAQSPGTPDEPGAPGTSGSSGAVNDFHAAGSAGEVGASEGSGVSGVSGGAGAAEGVSGASAEGAAGASGTSGPSGTSVEDVVTEAVLTLAGRATLPLQGARRDQNYGTAFWYNDLVEVTDESETIRQYLVTAEPQTRYEVGQFSLREGLITPELPADELVLPGFARKWSPLGDLGVAVMPTVELHLHAERKGWAWAAQEITAGLAARAEDIETLGTEPLPAYLLGHEVTEPGTRHPGRPQRLIPGTVTRTAEGTVEWSGPLPQGCAGAPVFAGLPHEEEGQVKLVCLGLALPGEPVTLVTFDALRPAIHTLSPARKRHWWQRG